MGLERLTCQVLGLKNVREATLQSLSAAYKATREADEAPRAPALEAGQALKSLWERAVADLPLDPNLVDKPLLAGAPDYMQIRLGVLDQVRDRPELLDLYEKLGLRFWTLELEKDLPFLPLRDLITFPRILSYSA